MTTNLLDERIHRTGKQDEKNQALIKSMVPLLQKVKQFVDTHPGDDAGLLLIL